MFAFLLLLFKMSKSEIGKVFSKDLNVWNFYINAQELSKWFVKVAFRTLKYVYIFKNVHLVRLWIDT